MSAWFDEDGRFKSVEDAVAHAIVIQGGFTTPEIEADRMAHDRDPVIQEMGRAWLDAAELGRVK